MRLSPRFGSRDSASQDFGERVGKLVASTLADSCLFAKFPGPRDVPTPLDLGLLVAWVLCGLAVHAARTPVRPLSQDTHGLLNIVPKLMPLEVNEHQVDMCLCQRARHSYLRL